MDSRDEEIDMEFSFIKENSVSQREKVKAFWKFLDAQNCLQPHKVIAPTPRAFELPSKTAISIDVIDGRRITAFTMPHEGQLSVEVVGRLMELERAGIWMSRVAHIPRGTAVVYRISLVQEVDVVSSKVRRHGSYTHEWTGGF